MRIWATFLFAVFVFFPVSEEPLLFAQDGPMPPALSMGDDELQAKTKEIAKVLRCAVCQSESVWESNSTLAIQMRDIVRERLLAGESSDEIQAYFVSRYGDYIIFKPRFRGINLLLWGGPFLLLLFGGVILLRNLSKWTKPHPALPEAPSASLDPIDEKQRQRLEQELRKG
ncbi:Cytochrome c heme lyase subunit CcmL [hydrothermal vent metagenome]|uniref:Cytochrome c heme lyase subunit CcmL n=1 Tax=hydrothermal vent metagenome TaxID=652676 RepID=A0A3B1D7Q8_9ZZZZ